MQGSHRTRAGWARRAAALLCALAAIAAVPSSAQQHPGSEGVRTFSNWAVACDNLGGCQMASLSVPDDLQPRQEYLRREHLMIAVRALADAATPEVLVRVPRPQAGWEISVDGVPAASVSNLRGLEWRITGAPARQLVRRLAAGREARLVDAVAEEAGVASLSGVTAGLLFIDEAQGRQGTVAGLALALQRRWQTRLRAAPVIRVPARSTRPAAPLVEPPFDTACRNDGPRAQRTIVRLDANTTLLLVPHPCISGAYNLMVSAFVADNGGRQRPARFDSDAGLDGDGDNPVLTNALWDAQAHRLETVSLARSYGDCGTRNRFVWDGTGFRLVFRAVMPDCRGNYLWLPVWRARVEEDRPQE